MKTLYLLSIPFLLLAAQCIPEKPEPPEPDLPPITITGENTFGCKINGEVWLPKGSFPNVPRLTADWYYGGVNIKANRKANDDLDGVIYLNAYNVFNAGTFEIDSDSTAEAQFHSDVTCIYDRDSIRIGEIEIIYLDTNNRIISGAFWFNASASGCEDIEVTDGRFDINY